MTTILDENVHNVSVEGSFDDCQAMVKVRATLPRQTHGNEELRKEGIKSEQRSPGG